MSWPAKTLCYDERRRKRFDGGATFTKDAEFEYREFRQGIILFNSGEFFKAHEVWEKFWLIAAETDKLFLQGMIQVAAAFHHYLRGNVNGTRSLLEAGLEKLGKYPDGYWGTNLKTLRGVVESWVEALARGERAALGDFPQIEFVDRDH